MNDNDINNTLALRSELEKMKFRISTKITHIAMTHRKLPFERLSKGRQLKELVTMAINAIDQGNEKLLNKYMNELINRGLKFSKFY